MADQFPPRLHVLLARYGPQSVVFRQGPSKVFCTIGWDRASDTFTIGQWLKAHVYVRRSDLSSNGKYLIYFARDHRPHRVADAWTAISRAPYLKAIGLWPKDDCWCGGGLFPDAASYWVNGGSEWESFAPAELEQVYDIEREHAVGAECRSIYYPRLVRDGWNVVRAPDDIDEQSGSARGEDYLFEKTIPGGWSILKQCFATTKPPQGRGVYFDEHALRNNNSGIVLNMPHWEWADWDEFRNRLIWCTGGVLQTGSLENQELANVQTLYDCNHMTFQALEAPY